MPIVRILKLTREETRRAHGVLPLPENVCATYWYTGECSAGENCRFRHELPVFCGDRGPTPIPDGICPNAWAGTECSSRGCQLLHISPDNYIQDPTEGENGIGGRHGFCGLDRDDLRRMPTAGLCGQFLSTGACNRAQCPFWHLDMPLYIHMADAAIARGAAGSRDIPRVIGTFAVAQNRGGLDQEMLHEGIRRMIAQHHGDEPGVPDQLAQLMMLRALLEQLGGDHPAVPNGPASDVSIHVHNGGDAEPCSICQSAFEDGERVAVIDRCRHGFHVDCLAPWAREHRTCPNCRTHTSPDNL